MSKKLYCEKCGAELYTGNNSELFEDDMTCPIYGYHHGSMKLIPDFETPEQYEKRTGKKWNGAVWRKYKYITRGHSTKWIAQTYTGNLDNFYLLCANSPEPPPDDYVPEEEA